MTIRRKAWKRWRRRCAPPARAGKDVVVEALEQPDRERQAEGQIGEDQRAVRVHKAEPPHEDEQRNEEDHGREHVAQQHGEEEEVPAREAKREKA